MLSKLIYRQFGSVAGGVVAYYQVTYVFLKEAKVQDIDYDQVVGPVEHVEHEEDGREQVHGHPVHPLIRYLYLLPDTPTVPLVVAPLSVNLLQ